MAIKITPTKQLKSASPTKMKRYPIKKYDKKTTTREWYSLKIDIALFQKTPFRW